MKYAGLGSRETPEDIIELFVKIGKELAERKYTLRSGGAEGADSAFEEGAILANGKTEIFIPWSGFNGSKSTLIGATPKALKLASTLHPAWDKCSKWARVLHGRNCYQILGLKLNDPVDFLICYTEKGLIQGGTSTAIRLAMKHNIQIYNFGVYSQREKFQADFNIEVCDDSFSSLEF